MRQAKAWKWWTATLALVLVFALATMALAGCRAPEGRPPGDTGSGDGSDGSGSGNSGSGDSGNEVALVLYFADSQAMFLVREDRVVTADEGDTYESLALKALIEGPKDEGDCATIPEGTKLLGVEVKDGVAYADFSKELKENHWGGSAGETMTIYSIVNTLTESGDIIGVKILVEGQEIETLAGHYDLTQVFERDEDLIASGS